MKFAVTIHQSNNLKKLSEAGADIFLIGNSAVANRLTASFDEDEIVEMVNEIHNYQKEVYLLTNIIAHQTDLASLRNYLSLAKENNVDGIIYGDLAVYNIAKELDIIDKLIYNPETLNTNYYDAVFWKRKGIKGLIIAKEITYNDIVSIANNADLEIGMIGHGHLNMFHSRRPLIENFMKYNEKEYEAYIENRNLRLVEEIRDESYPIFQDHHGTHIFREKAMMSFEEISQLQNGVDLFIIDSIFKSDQYTVDVLKDYNRIIDNDIQVDDIVEKYKSNHDTGFLHKKTVYDKY
jgi:putative protease